MRICARPTFFEVEKFPKITFRSKKITHDGGEKFKLMGDLTIKETTREITFDVDLRRREQGSVGQHCDVPSPPTAASAARISS